MSVCFNLLEILSCPDAPQIETHINRFGLNQNHRNFAKKNRFAQTPVKPRVFLIFGKISDFSSDLKFLAKKNRKNRNFFFCASPQNSRTFGAKFPHVWGKFPHVWGKFPHVSGNSRTFRGNSRTFRENSRTFCFWAFLYFFSRFSEFFPTLRFFRFWSGKLQNFQNFGFSVV